MSQKVKYIAPRTARTDYKQQSTTELYSASNL